MIKGISYFKRHIENKLTLLQCSINESCTYMQIESGRRLLHPEKRKPETMRQYFDCYIEQLISVLVPREAPAEEKQSWRIRTECKLL